MFDHTKEQRLDKLSAVVENGAVMHGLPLNKALQPARHSSFQSGSGSLLVSTSGALASVGGLCNAAERPVR